MEFMPGRLNGIYRIVSDFGLVVVNLKLSGSAASSINIIHGIFLFADALLQLMSSVLNGKGV